MAQSKFSLEVTSTLTTTSDLTIKTSNSNRLHLTKNMLVSPEDVIYSKQYLCRDGEYFRICSAELHYGSIRVNWKYRTILLGVINRNTESASASVLLSF